MSNPNTITGYEKNAVGYNIGGAFVSGGGASEDGDSPNLVNGNFGVVSGGCGNEANGMGSVVAGGTSNVAKGPYSAIMGGARNSTDGGTAVVCGGQFNRAEGQFAFVGGGALNFAKGSHALVFGGFAGCASGEQAVVAGGVKCQALGAQSFAAGNRATASYVGQFVWADSQDADFTPDGDNTFCIRAAGGLWVNGTRLDDQSAKIAKLEERCTTMEKLLAEYKLALQAHLAGDRPKPATNEK